MPLSLTAYVYLQHTAYWPLASSIMSQPRRAADLNCGRHAQHSCSLPTEGGLESWQRSDKSAGTLGLVHPGQVVQDSTGCQSFTKHTTMTFPAYNGCTCTLAACSGKHTQRSVLVRCRKRDQAAMVQPVLSHRLYSTMVARTATSHRTAMTELPGS